MKRLAQLLSGPLVFVGILLLPLPSLSADGQTVLALTGWMAVWWILEAVPLAVTALLPLLILPVFGAVELRPTAEVYASPIIYLFLGGFLLALGVERWHLHQRIALAIIAAVGSNSRLLILGFMVATALLYMWISNTATTLMMLPIAIAIYQQFKEWVPSKIGQPFAKALLLGVAYSASIGGVATLIGTPTNLIFSAASDEILGEPVDFLRWMQFAMPLSLLMLGVCWWYLTHVAFRLGNQKVAALQQIITDKRKALGPMTYEEKAVAAVFSLVAFFWITSSLVWQRWLPGLNDTSIAIGGAILLFLIPNRQEKGGRLMDWTTAKQLPWGILLLFGGGLSLAAGFKATGLDQWMGEQFTFLEGAPLWLVFLLLIAMVNFLTEITSNVATASVLLPIFAAIAASLGLHPHVLMVACAVTASFAFMLPVATAPNAVVFSSGELSIKEMARAGVGLNLISIVVLTVYHYAVMPILW